MGKIFKETNLFPIAKRLINCMKKTYALAQAEWKRTSGHLVSANLMETHSENKCLK